ncbi:MAG: YncE family protein [Rhodocyclaceae bacterium]|nr:YncE family protein [Rhodocyclaceae bacterium]
MTGKGFKALAIAAAIWGMGSIGSAPVLAANEVVAPAESIATPQAISDRFVRDGLVIDFKATPVEGSEIMEGLLADVRFSITQEATGEPVKGIFPAAWLDVGANIGGKAGEIKECRDKVGLYLKGIVGIRPMLDLNGYYVLVLNKDPSISVVDPMVNMAGRTSTYAIILLKRPPMDWARSNDEKQLFVSMPVADEIAVVDADHFKVTHNVPAGDNPTRVVVQPDGRYVWVGNNGIGAKSGVTVIDAETFKPVGFIATGAGHHEINFSDDSAHAFVTNRDSGSVSVIDVAKLEKVKDIAIGKQVLSVGYSALAKAAYVADGKTGQIAIIDGKTLEVRKRIQSHPGLGPLRVSPDGRWVMTANTLKDQVLAIDAATDQVVNSIDIAGEPFQLTFSRSFAYVRGLSTSKVNLINLSTLGEGKKPIVNSFDAGSKAPKLAGDLPLADTMTAATTDTSAFIVNPADNTTYFYMEGMNAPMSNYKSFGHVARAAKLVDRSLKEVEPGVYSTKVRLPVDGRFDVALMLDTPNLVHCFSMTASRNPTMHQAGTWGVEFVGERESGVVGQTSALRFRVIDPVSEEVKEGVKDAVVTWYRSPAFERRQAVAVEVEPGIYQVDMDFAAPGAHFAFVQIPSLKINQENSRFRSIKVSGMPVAKADDQKP